MVPEYVPSASPDGFTDTLKFDGVVALAGVAESQPLPSDVEILTLNAVCAPLLPMATVCAGGAVLPIPELNVSVAGCAVRFVDAVIVRPTGICTADPDDGVRVTVPEYVPGPNLPESTDTLKVLGVEPPPGETDNHPPPLTVAALAVNVSDVPELPTEMLCDGGAAPPVWNINASELGDGIKAFPDVTVTVIGITNPLFAALFEVIVIPLV